MTKKSREQLYFNNSNHKNDVSFKEYFNSRFDELKEYMDSKFENMEKSNILERENLHARLEGMNEFRNSMKDQTANYITRSENDVVLTKYDSDIRYLREYVAKIEGKASMNSVYISYIIATIGLIIGTIGLFLKGL